MADTAERDVDLRAFLIHLAVFVAGIAILAGINLMQAPPEGQAREYWFLWALAGWGIGVLAHGLALWLKRLGEAGGLMAEQDVRGAAIHLFVYLAVNTLLIVVNFVVTPGSIWFFWPLVGWGAGLAVHAWLVYRAVLKRTVEHYALEQRLIGEIAEERRAELQAAAKAAIAASAPVEARQAAPPTAKRAPAKKRAAAGKSSKAKQANGAAKAAASAPKQAAKGKAATRPKRPAAKRASSGTAAKRRTGASARKSR